MTQDIIDLLEQMRQDQRDQTEELWNNGIELLEQKHDYLNWQKQAKVAAAL